MSNQFDLFDQPPPHLARAHRAEDITNRPWTPPDGGSHKWYHAAQELIHFTSYLKLSDWQQRVLWPHLKNLLEKIKAETREEICWFELGYIISAMEIEQLRSRAAALEICKKYGVEL